MEPRFGYHFSRVRVHTDAQAAELARAVNALAYTVGQDIVFGAGRYAPETDDGERLIAHELTHTIQQNETKSLQRAAASSDPEAMLDRAISIVQQVLDAIDSSAGEGQSISPENEERAGNLRVVLDNLLDLKGSGNSDEMFKAAKPIVAAAEGGSSGGESSGAMQRKSIVNPDSDSLEREAEAAAGRISQGHQASDLLLGGASQFVDPMVQRQGGPAEATMVGLGVAAGPVGWAALAAVGIVALIAAGVYLATRPRSETRTRERARPREGETGRRGDCNAMMSACLLTSLADQPGSVFGQSRCLWCAEVCRREGGVWPGFATSTAGQVRCDFWNFPGTE